MSIQGTAIKNRTLRLILTGSDTIDEEMLKQLEGATAHFVTENIRLVDKNLTGALILEVKQEKKDDRQIKEMEGDTGTRI